MIIIDKLKKNFGEKIAVDIEHYEINQGDMLGLVGNNGAGKTTLFRIMLDLLKADDGKVIINDIDVSQSEDWKSITGAFIDDGFLIDYLTPEEYFYFIGKMYGLKKEEVDERLIPFERFMSGEVIGHKKLIRNYSAGNKQKIGIISAMLHYPQLLILDEPFNFLDPSSQSIIKHLLKKYNEEHQATVIISSHNLNHTVDVCPRIALLEHGVIIRDIIKWKYIYKYTLIKLYIFSSIICQYSCRISSSDLNMSAQRTWICIFGLKKIRIFKFFHSNLAQFIIIFTVHFKINIIIPWDKSFVPDSSKGCSTITKNLYIIFFTDFYDFRSNI